MEKQTGVPLKEIKMEVCVCGSVCGSCEAFPNIYQGCDQTRGKIFWAKKLLAKDTCDLPPERDTSYNLEEG
jgi:hypothetical protein